MLRVRFFTICFIFLFRDFPQQLSWQQRLTVNQIQVLDDGQGNTINFKNTVIIATSNAGFGYEKGLVENVDKQEIIERLKLYFRPEFLNRFNAVIEFSYLNKKDLSQIVDLMLIEVNKTLSKKEIDLAVSDAAKEFLTEGGYDEVMGVRPLRRVIEQQIRDNVTDFYLENLDAKHLVADLEDGILVIKEKSETDKKNEEKKVSKTKKSSKKDTEQLII